MVCYFLLCLPLLGYAEASEPIYTAEFIKEKTIKYLTESENRDMSGYKIKMIRFVRKNLYGYEKSTGVLKHDYIEGYWILLFSHKSLQKGKGFSVDVPNRKELHFRVGGNK